MHRLQQGVDATRRGSTATMGARNGHRVHGMLPYTTLSPPSLPHPVHKNYRHPLPIPNSNPTQPNPTHFTPPPYTHSHTRTHCTHINTSMYFTLFFSLPSTAGVCRHVVRHNFRPITLPTRPQNRLCRYPTVCLATNRDVKTRNRELQTCPFWDKIQPSHHS